MKRAKDALVVLVDEELSRLVMWKGKGEECMEYIFNTCVCMVDLHLSTYMHGKHIID